MYTDYQIIRGSLNNESVGVAQTSHDLSAKHQQADSMTLDPTLMNAAFTSPLSIAQQEVHIKLNTTLSSNACNLISLCQTLLHMIESDPESLKNHLPLDHLPDLIEQNQAIAIEALNVLAETPEFSE